MRFFNWILISLIVSTVVSAEKLKVGVTLHPYYSFVRNIVGDSAEVIPLVENNVNTHNYKIRPADVKRVENLDVVVLNGIGHDEFALQILKAAGMFKKLDLIYANDNVPLTPQYQGASSVNSHTFISIENSIIQIYTISRELGKIDPGKSEYYRKNALKYVKRLRALKAEYGLIIDSLAPKGLNCATVHGGYSDFLREFGISVISVIEPSHGVNPTAAQLRNSIDLLKKQGVKIVFSEKDYPSTLVKTIKNETGVLIVGLSHLSGGEYTADYFENGMKYNLKKLVYALSYFY